MISRLSGKLIDKSESSIIIDIKGIGFEILLSKKHLDNLPDIGNEIVLEIYTYVREDAIRLIGFNNKKEKKFFLQLLDVSGVSIRTALSAFSTYSTDEIAKFIIDKEVDFITRIPGIGKKLAERIILELKGKLIPDDYDMLLKRENIIDEDKLHDIEQALSTLGYKKIEIRKLLSDITEEDLRDKKTEELIKIALRSA